MPAYLSFAPAHQRTQKVWLPIICRNTTPGLQVYACTLISGLLLRRLALPLDRQAYSHSCGSPLHPKVTFSSCTRLQPLEVSNTRGSLRDTSAADSLRDTSAAGGLVPHRFQGFESRLCRHYRPVKYCKKKAWPNSTCSTVLCCSDKCTRKQAK
jgi:hypothetical protein